MITILKGKDITVEWKVVSLETKQPTVFISNETHVFLIAPNDIYTLPFEVVREDFCGLRVTIPTAYLTTGVYDLKVIWLKDVMRESLVNKLEYRNASIKREVFSLTDDVSEVTYEGEIIKIVSGAETFGRDGMSAYEIAAFRGVLPKGMSEAEWANQENVRQQNEAKRESTEDERITAEAARQQNELKRESQESVRTETFNAKERGREQAFDDAQSRRDAEFQRSEASRSNTFATNEQTRQQSFEANETSRQHQEAARVIAEGARVTAEALRKQAEEARENTFAANEQTRQTTFEDNEEKREDAFNEAIQAAKDNLIVVNDLTTGGDNKALSAEMGKTLYDKLRLSSSLYINSQGYVEVKVDERTIRSTYNGIERAPLKLRHDYFSENPDILLNGGLVADEYSYLDFPTLKVGTLDDTIEVETNGIKVSSSVIKKLDETNTLALKLSSDIESYATKESVEEVKSELTEAIEQIEEGKVDKDDNAPKLTAGFANNLVGRGEATDEEISFRPSGGDTSIEDGTARIERLKGNTVVWNQLLKCEFANGETYGGTVKPTVQDGKGYLTFTATVDSFTTQFMATTNHYYLWKAKLSASTGCRLFMHSYGVLTTLSASTDMKVVQGIVQYKSNSVGRSVMLLPLSNITEPTDMVVDYYHLYDLTQMFGAGNEPTTIEEFNARKPIGIDEYTYNEGELISTNVEGIKSVGFNAWDEEWEFGAIIDGKDDSYAGHIRSKNYIPVLPNTDYFFKSTDELFLSWYDEEYNYIPLGNLKVNNNIKKSPENAHYLRFYAYNSTTYNHDICIHLVHTGYRNGEYEPYKEFRRSLPISEIKDSEGNQLFPNGLLSAGSVRDEITATKAIKRIGVVDLGTLSWDYNTGVLVFHCAFNDAKKTPDGYTPANIICSKYTNSSFAKLSDKSISRFYAYSDGLNIKDSFYTDATTFKAAMSGVMLYYELVEPIEVDLEEPINLDYEVSDFGTEEVISDVPTTPLKADIIYQFNAVDRIRDNSRHTAEAEGKLKDYEARIKSLEDIVAALTQQTPSGEEVINQG